MKDVNLLKSNGIDVDKSLELFGDMQMYDETLAEFISSSKEKLSLIKEYKEVSNMADYAIQVHSLKSDSKYLGFTKLAELSYSHELKSKENDFNYVNQNYDELMDEAKRVLDLVCEYMGMENESLPKEAEVKSIKDKSILVVDDSNIIRNFVKKIFSDEYEVIVANDGAEALDLIARHDSLHIEAVLLDLNMPNVDGFGVLDYFKENNLFVKVPVSIITGDDAKDTINRAFTYPIVDVLAKPFNERDIKRVVDKTLSFR